MRTKTRVVNPKIYKQIRNLILLILKLIFKLISYSS
jgi:hypothetical protein